jgi:hypothetical protein
LLHQKTFNFIKIYFRAANAIPLVPKIKMKHEIKRETEL